MSKKWTLLQLGLALSIAFSTAIAHADDLTPREKKIHDLYLKNQDDLTELERIEYANMDGWIEQQRSLKQEIESEFAMPGREVGVLKTIEKQKGRLADIDLKLDQVETELLASLEKTSGPSIGRAISGFFSTVAKSLTMRQEDSEISLTWQKASAEPPVSVGVELTHRQGDGS
jgi:hypothetical protein